MPYINLKMTKENGGATTSQKAALIEGFTRVFADIMGRGRQTTVVIIDEIDTDNYGIGGEPVTGIRRKKKA